MTDPKFNACSNGFVRVSGVFAKSFACCVSADPDKFYKDGAKNEEFYVALDAVLVAAAYYA